MYNFKDFNGVRNQVIVKVSKNGYPEASKCVRINLCSPLTVLSNKSLIKMLHHFTKYSLKVVPSATLAEITHDISAYQIEETFSNIKLGYTRVHLKEVEHNTSCGKISIPRDFYIKGVTSNNLYTFFHIDHADSRITLSADCVSNAFNEIKLKVTRCKDTSPFPNSFFSKDIYKIVKCEDDYTEDNVYEVFKVEKEVIKDGEEFVEI